MLYSWHDIFRAILSKTQEIVNFFMLKNISTFRKLNNKGNPEISKVVDFQILKSLLAVMSLS